MPFISFGGAAIIVNPVRKWVFKIPHTDRMAADKNLQDMKARGIPSPNRADALALSFAYPVKARTLPGGGMRASHAVMD